MSSRRAPYGYGRRRSTYRSRYPYYTSRRITAPNYQSRNLTGGTGDVNPQWFKFKVTQTAADVNTQLQVTLPVTRTPTSSKVTIMEVLKVRATSTAGNWMPAAAIQYVNIAFGSSNLGTGAGNEVFPDNPHVFAYLHAESVATASALNQTLEQDLTDGNGHGVLVATDSMYVQLNSLATAVANEAAIEILYRFKSVGMKEYTGIVQSQQ